MKPTKIRTVYLLERNGHAAAAPSCELELTASGRVVYRVRSTSRTLRHARELAEAEFRRLARFAKTMVVDQ